MDRFPAPLSALVLSIASCTSFAQSWSPPVEVVDIRGTGGPLGGFVSSAIIAGRPAFVAAENQFGGRFIAYSRADDVDGTSWPIARHTGVPFLKGRYMQLLEVGGMPAFFYEDNALMYVRANDIDGTSWGAPIVVDEVPGVLVGAYCSAVVVDGNPAVAYRRGTPDNSLYYIRANDALGASWGSPLQIQVGTDDAACSMAVVNGNPAIVFNRPLGTPVGVLFTRANDPQGTNWSAPVQLQPAVNELGDVELKVINGVPAVVYSFREIINNAVRFRYANDPDGTSWNVGWSAANQLDSDPVYGLVDLIPNGNGYYLSYHDYSTGELKVRGYPDLTQPGFVLQSYPNITFPAHHDLLWVNGTCGAFWRYPTGNDTKLGYQRGDPANYLFPWGNIQYLTGFPRVGDYLSQAIINGNPALAYYDRDNKDLRYIRALDPLGQTWGTSVTVDSVGDCGEYTSLAEVDGYPAIAYHDEAVGLRYVRANDAQGSTWGAPLTLGPGGEGIKLGVISGRPAITFLRGAPNSLRYLRANDAQGTSWPVSVQVGVGTPDRAVDMVEWNGNPMVAWHDGVGIDTRLAQDPDGVAWWAPFVVASSVPTTNHKLDLNIVNGMPSITWFAWAGVNSTLSYRRGATSGTNGVSFSGVSTIYSASSSGGECQLLALGDSIPAVIAKTNLGLVARQATNTSGSSWTLPASVTDQVYAPAENVSAVQYGTGVGVSFTLGPSRIYYLSGEQCADPVLAPTNTTDPADLAICAGESTTLSATGTMPIWTTTFSTNPTVAVGNTYTVSPTLSTTIYYVRDSACYRSNSTQIVVTTTTVNTNVTANANTLTAEQAGALYQWLDCNNGYAPIPGEDQQSFTGNTGNYAVEVTYDGCVDTSACQQIIITGVQEQAATGVLAFPVPATDHVFLRIPDQRMGVRSVRIVGVDGRSFDIRSGAYSSSYGLLRIDLPEELAAGLFSIQVVTENDAYSLKVIHTR